MSANVNVLNLIILEASIRFRGKLLIRRDGIIRVIASLNLILNISVKSVQELVADSYVELGISTDGHFLFLSFKFIFCYFVVHRHQICLLP